MELLDQHGRPIEAPAPAKAPRSKPRRPFDPPDPDTPAVRDAQGRTLCPVCKRGLARLPYGFCEGCTGDWDDYETAMRVFQNKGES